MFEIDAQTIKELQILSSIKGEKSVLSIFNNVASYGGRDQLEILFRNPLSSLKSIQDRVDCIKYLEAGKFNIKVDATTLDFIEHYLSLSKIPTRYSYIDGLRKRLHHILKANNEYYIISRAIEWMTEIIKNLYSEICLHDQEKFPALLREISGNIRELVESEGLFQIYKHNGKRFSAYEIEKFNHILKYKRLDDVRELLRIIYLIDVFQAVIKTKKRYGFSFAELSETHNIEIQGLYHPFLEKPIPNDISITESCNAVFITGANMSGKSTFMKAFGVSIYLAHMGFPVPARNMMTPVFDGLFTTINIPDDLLLGYSHFYSEVKRIKDIAKKVVTGKSYVIIFDELFRGTNVKDASEATFFIINSLSKIKGNTYLFSSHIIEAAEELAQASSEIKFLSFQATMKDNSFSYSYLIEPGVSNDRFGMYIIEREGIIELLNEGIENGIPAKPCV